MPRQRSLAIMGYSNSYIGMVSSTAFGYGVISHTTP